MLKDFKAFLFRGNLLDLAVAVILGAAFGAVVTAFIRDLITPLLAAIGGKPDFASLSFTVNHSRFLYGDFVNFLINFVVIAAVMYGVLKAAARAQKLRATTDAPADEAVPPTDEALLLAEIRDLLRANGGPARAGAAPVASGATRRRRSES